MSIFNLFRKKAKPEAEIANSPVTSESEFRVIEADEYTRVELLDEEGRLVSELSFDPVQGSWRGTALRRCVVHSLFVDTHRLGSEYYPVGPTFSRFPITLSSRDMEKGASIDIALDLKTRVPRP